MVPSILLVMQEPRELFNKLQIAIDVNAHVRFTTSGIAGLHLIQIYNPTIIIIDDTLPDLHGSSLATIIKDFSNPLDCQVYIVNIGNSILPNSKADYFITSDCNLDKLVDHIIGNFNNKMLQSLQHDAYEEAIILQNKMLPQPLKTNEIAVNHIFSPFSTLSGDGLNYWIAKDCLYGFIFDCIGHDLSSHLQAQGMWTYLKKALKMYQMGVWATLAAAMTDINNDLFDTPDNTAGRCSFTPALLFILDYQKNILKYCPAGFPAFLIKENTAPKAHEVLLKSTLLGVSPKAKYEEYTISTKNLNEIIISTDGFLDLMNINNNQKLFSAKADDVSAIFIHFLQNDVQLEHQNKYQNK